jgi:hypothetical protein
MLPEPGPNRATSHKSLPVTDDQTSLFQNLERVTPEQLAQLKKSYWFNNDKCPEEVIESMKLDLLDKMNKPRVFEKKHHYQLDPLVLFTQFERQLSVPSKGGKAPTPEDILHNFTRRSAIYRQLFRWAPHSTVSRVFQPIHYQIHVKGPSQSPNRPNPPRIESLADLQNVMIHSYSGASTIHIRPPQLVEKIEDVLDAILSQILMRSSRALFVFEWRESPRFQYVLCFDLSLSTGIVESAPSILTMTRNDLFDEQLSTSELKSDSERGRRLLREGQPSYVFNAFVRCDD